MVTFGIVPLFLLLVPLELARFRWSEAAFHFAFGMLASLLLMEAMFLGFRKVPFTLPEPGTGRSPPLR